MNNKLCVITGANSGIGFETAKAMAEREAFVVMVCRDIDKAEAARSRIINETGNQGIVITICDFSIQSEIRAAANEILEKFEKIDILINNHGFIASEREETVDGLEKTFAVNHIGYFLFTNLLMEAIKKADNARIISVSSDAHRSGKFDQSDLQLKEGFSPMKAYANSKLYNILFTKELAERIVDEDITANCLHPGVVATNFGQSGNLLTRLFFSLGKMFLISPEKGAETTIYLATSNEVKDVNGAYFKNCKVVTPSAEARDEGSAKELWNISSKLCGI